MTELIKENHAINAHEFLQDFLNKFYSAARGGIHDFMEITLFNMINSSIKNIDDYLESGHKQVNANEIMHIVVDSYQKVLDNIKRNLDDLNEVNFSQGHNHEKLLQKS